MTNKTELDIEAVNFEARIALLTNDEVVPITNFFGDDGEDVDDHTLAVSFVCGKDNVWFAASVDAFKEEGWVQ